MGSLFKYLPFDETPICSSTLLNVVQGTVRTENVPQNLGLYCALQSARYISVQGMFVELKTWNVQILFCTLRC